MHRYTRTLLYVVLGSCLVACGGVQNVPSSAPFAALPDARTALSDASKHVTAKLVIRIPRRRHHRARFVSPSTQSIVITTQETAPVPGSAKVTYANLVSGSPGCSGSGVPFTCTVTLTGLSARATYSLTFVTYDATQTSSSTPHKGNVLSQNTVSKTIVAGANNTIGVVLDGVPASFAVVPAANTQPFAGNTSTGLYFGYVNPQAWTISTLDADGNFIIGPGAPNVTASIDVGATGGIAVAPSTSNPNKFTMSATGVGTGTLLLSAPIPGSSTPLSLGAGLTAGTLMTTIAGQLAPNPGVHGSADGTGTQAQFFRPRGLAYNASSGDVYIADASNCTIRQLVPSTLAVSTVAGSAGTCSYQNGTASGAYFNAPYAIAADNAGNLYVTDTLNYAIRIIAPGGVVTKLTGDNGSGTGSGGPGTAQFEDPVAIAYDPDDNDLYVVDELACTVRQVTLVGTPGTVKTIAGVDGTCDGNNSDFQTPEGIVYAGNQTLYVADSGNCEIRRITNIDSVPQQDTVAAPFAGSTACSEGDGTGTGAGLALIGAIAYDSTHSALYAIDGTAIRAVTLPGAVVTTIAGTFASTAHVDGWQALFKGNAGIAYDPASSTLYVSDVTEFIIEEVQL